MGLTLRLHTTFIMIKAMITNTKTPPSADKPITTYFLLLCGEDLVASSARGDETRRVGLVNLVLVAAESKRK